ncbi:hypothetical protein Tco_0881690 [Tanacetum coccineum]
MMSGRRGITLFPTGSSMVFLQPSWLGNAEISESIGDNSSTQMRSHVGEIERYRLAVYQIDSYSALRAA